MSNKKPQLVLASASPRRLELLAQINITPDAVIPADINEDPHSGELPRLYAQRMAREKLAAIIPQTKNAFCLAADTVVACGRRILGKPEDADEAKKFLTLLGGRRHRVLTSIAVKSPNGQIVERISTSHVKLNRLDDGAMSAYIDSGEWQGKAGGYGIQGMAAQYVAWIEGSYTGIVGLPLFETAQVLQGMGYPILNGHQDSEQDSGQASHD